MYSLRFNRRPIRTLLLGRYASISTGFAYRAARIQTGCMPRRVVQVRESMPDEKHSISHIPFPLRRIVTGYSHLRSQGFKFLLYLSSENAVLTISKNQGAFRGYEEVARFRSKFQAL